MRKAYSWLIILLLAAPAAASAQERGFVLGLAGLTFAENNSYLLGAKAGVSVSQNIQIVGTYEYMRDVLTSDLASALGTVGKITNLRIEGKIPTNYLAGGVRFNFATGGGVHPYVQVEVGVAKIAPELTVLSDGEDITDQVDLQLDETNAAAGISAGLRADFGDSLTSEFGFKWVNIFTDETLKINRVHFGIGARF